jgi:hypothetical protein
MPNIFALVFPAPDGECQIATNATGNKVTPLRSFPGTKLILTALALASGPKGEQLEVTDLESTLIDIAVPPAYADGVTSALRTYTLASKGSSQILPKREEGTESLRTVIGKAKAREPKSSSRTAPNE